MGKRADRLGFPFRALPRGQIQLAASCPPGARIARFSSSEPERQTRGAGVGRGIAAEWAHFVAFGVYAYDVGGPAAVGIAGLVHLLPAAIVAPFAATLGDRFPRERFLLALTLVASVALGASAIAFFADVESLVFAFAALLGFAVTLIRPALRHCSPRSRALPRSSLRRWRHVDDRELGHARRAAARRCSRIGGERRDRVRRRSGGAARGGVPAPRSQGRGPGQPDCARRRCTESPCGGVRCDCAQPAPSPRRLADRRSGVRPRLPERLDRRRSVSRFSTRVERRSVT